MKNIYFLLTVFIVSSASSFVFADDLQPAWIENESKQVKKGFDLYVNKGCALCHGYAGQGSPMSGPRLTRNLPFAYIELNVRRPVRNMPLYLDETLNDAELTDIVAFINALPESKSPNQIELLKNIQ